tara:strand:+ start:5921 stop:6289 length:369 start_codon:yes stop_codon:yes gene_type:complete
MTDIADTSADLLMRESAVNAARSTSSMCDRQFADMIQRELGRLSLIPMADTKEKMSRLNLAVAALQSKISTIANADSVVRMRPDCKAEVVRILDDYCTRTGLGQSAIDEAMAVYNDVSNATQ